MGELVAPSESFARKNAAPTLTVVFLEHRLQAQSQPRAARQSFKLYERVRIGLF